mmetsp:Transcript_24526/g.78856  ORF Transcript_24526/g.78856 Transcript_24526/m.78856 type:complete len:406 (-) Transcript_24526:493-1710(-)
MGAARARRRWYTMGAPSKAAEPRLSPPTPTPTPTPPTRPSPPMGRGMSPTRSRGSGNLGAGVDTKQLASRGSFICADGSALRASPSPCAVASPSPLVSGRGGRRAVRWAARLGDAQMAKRRAVSCWDRGHLRSPSVTAPLPSPAPARLAPSTSSSGPELDPISIPTAWSNSMETMAPSRRARTRASCPPTGAGKERSAEAASLERPASSDSATASTSTARSEEEAALVGGTARSRRSHSRRPSSGWQSRRCLSWADALDVSEKEAGQSGEPLAESAGCSTLKGWRGRLRPAERARATGGAEIPTPAPLVSALRRTPSASAPAPSVSASRAGAGPVATRASGRELDTGGSQLGEGSTFSRGSSSVTRDINASGASADKLARPRWEAGPEVSGRQRGDGELRCKARK